MSAAVRSKQRLSNFRPGFLTNFHKSYASTVHTGDSFKNVDPMPKSLVLILAKEVSIQSPLRLVDATMVALDSWVHDSGRMWHSLVQKK
eukprot:7245714-Karenia_brevis.AAC.1